MPDDADTDRDGYSDGAEVDDGSNPRDPASIPGNLARTGTGILGTQSASGEETPVFNAGLASSINDGDPNTRVDSYNGGGTDPVSFVGLTWLEAQTNPVIRVKLGLATFLDGGWFGPNNRSPGAGQPLAATFLTEPAVQVSFDAGFTWTNTPAVSDYLTVMNGHVIGGGTNINPSFATVTFVLDPAISNLSGIRVIGTEGGVASGGFLGVTELEVYQRLDSEPDGMDDEWERQHGLVAGANDAAGDPDGDSLSNVQEFTSGTDPQKADTDDDGLNDGLEIHTRHTNPLSPDTDAGGLKDGDEVNTFGTDPLKVDTDNDLFPDGTETSLGSNATDASRIPANLALRMDATAILGTTGVPGGTDTPVFNAGAGANINDRTRNHNAAESEDRNRRLPRGIRLAQWRELSRGIQEFAR